MHTKLLTHISQFITLNKYEEELIANSFTIKELKRKEFYSKYNEKIDSLVFVNQGCLRSYLIDSNGIEKVLQFAPDQWWISDMTSILNNSPSTLCIQALEDSQILEIKRIDQLKLINSIPMLSNYFWKLGERAMSSYQQRLLDFLSLTAEERYIAFSLKYPTLVNTLAQKHIASYLGVTPEFFSKMRSNLLKKK